MVPYLMGGEALYAAASPARADEGQGGWIASWVLPLLPNTVEELQIWVVSVAVAVAVMGGLGSRSLHQFSSCRGHPRLLAPGGATR